MGAGLPSLTALLAPFPHYLLDCRWNVYDGFNVYRT